MGQARWIGPGPAACLAVALGSGALGLGHELLWTRRLVDLLGASGEATARVFGVFFLGLALGAAWMARRVGRIRRPLRAAAWAEAATAVGAIPAWTLPAWSAGFWPALGLEALEGPAGSVARLVLSLAVLLPPTVAMGTVLPLLAALLLGNGRGLGRQGVWLYAINTLGGVVGLGLTSVVLLPRLGASGAMAALIAGNLALAALLALADRLTGPAEAPSEPEPKAPPTPEPEAGLVAVPTWLIGVTAAFSGMGILASEVIGIELMMLVAPLSFFAPAVVLMAVILSLGLAAIALPFWRRRGGDGRGVLMTSLQGAALAMAVTPGLFMLLAERFGTSLTPAGSVSGFLGRLGGLTLLSLGPAFLIAGLVFPLTLALVQSKGSGTGRQSGATWLAGLLACNGLGAIFGAELAYRVVMPTLGLHLGLASIGGLYALAALAWVGVLPRRRGPSAIEGLIVLAIVGALALGWAARLPHVNPYAGFRVVDQRFGRDGVVSVVENDRIGLGLLVSNQYLLGSTEARWSEQRQGHLPLLLHDDPRRVAFVGVATGITPGASLSHDRVERVVAFEIARPIVELAAQHFRDGTNGLHDDPRCRIVVDDGRTGLAASPGRFDVIVGDLFLPWGPGQGRLFCVEHFQTMPAAGDPKPKVLRMIDPSYPCGTVSVAMITHMLGAPSSLETVEDTIDSNVFGNSTAADLVACLDELGFAAKAFELTNTRSLPASVGPAILHVDGSHFLVARGSSDGWTTLVDPPKSPRQVHADELGPMWDGVCIIIAEDDEALDRKLDGLGA